MQRASRGEPWLLSAHDRHSGSVCFGVGIWTGHKASASLEPCQWNENLHKPIVCSPEDAIRTFNRIGLDGLFIADHRSNITVCDEPEVLEKSITGSVVQQTTAMRLTIRRTASFRRAGGSTNSKPSPVSPFPP